MIALQQVQALLTGLPGIRAVDLSAFPDRIVLRCDPVALRAFTTEGIRQILGEAIEGLDPEIVVELVGLPAAHGRRSRFDRVVVSSTGPGTVRARVVLEWQGEEVLGEADGEASPAGELRACCMATLRAVEKAADGAVSFSLVGAKELYVFDHNLVAVLVHSPQLHGQQLIGTSIIAEDRRKSAALAVLSATNRAFGSFTEESDS